ncbi:MAG: hypothetical protein AAF211_31060, partial [Myxococcota bacterium]
MQLWTVLLMACAGGPDRGRESATSLSLQADPGDLRLRVEETISLDVVVERPSDQLAIVDLVGLPGGVTASRIGLPPGVTTGRINIVAGLNALAGESSLARLVAETPDGDRVSLELAVYVVDEAGRGPLESHGLARRSLGGGRHEPAEMVIDGNGRI